jgi:hypothetical protein
MIATWCCPSAMGREGEPMYLQNRSQIMMLRELAKGPVKDQPKFLYGSDMEYLITARYVDRTDEADNKASFEITEEGRKALKHSVGE